MAGKKWGPTVEDNNVLPSGGKIGLTSGGKTGLTSGGRLSGTKVSLTSGGDLCEASVVT